MRAAMLVFLCEQKLAPSSHTLLLWPFYDANEISSSLLHSHFMDGTFSDVPKLFIDSASAAADAFIYSLPLQ